MRKNLMNKVGIIVSASILTACTSMDNIPTSSPIYDDFITLVKEDVNLGKQTLYKNEKLDHYRIDNVDAYCSNMLSMNFELYRCFALEGNILTKGLNPKTSKWEKLTLPIEITKKSR